MLGVPVQRVRDEDGLLDAASDECHLVADAAGMDVAAEPDERPREVRWNRPVGARDLDGLALLRRDVAVDVERRAVLLRPRADPVLRLRIDVPRAALHVE